MKYEDIKVVANYNSSLSYKQESDILTAFFKLLFDDTDVIQVKEQTRIHPADAGYFGGEAITDLTDTFVGKQSDSGVQFCINAVPSTFSGKLHYLWKLEEVSQPHLDRLIPDLRDDLSLSRDLFERGRTFFIEADKMPNGNEIASDEDKKQVLCELLSSNLPISYILDTGGRGPHIGIVLNESVPTEQFDRVVKEVMQRLPLWIDGGVGRVNQLERFPNTLRINKRGEVVPVKLLYVGQRVQNHDLLKWIGEHPIINSEIRGKEPTWEYHQRNYEDLDDTEEAAWRFVSEYDLKSAKRIRNGKLQVACPVAQNHKKGRDKNMSAVIYVESGHVWCSACQDTVGRTLKGHFRRQRRQSPLIKSQDTKVDLESITPTKLF